MMKLTLLGTGTPVLETNRQGSAVLVQIAATNLLFDTGRGVTTQLLKVGLSAADLAAIFITHHHADHIGDLGDTIIAAWEEGRDVPVIYGPPGTREVVAALLNVVFKREIEFTLLTGTLNGEPLQDIRQTVQVIEIEPETTITGAGYVISPQYVDHGNGLGLSRNVWPCYGYRIEAEGKVIALSGDTIPCEGLDRLAHRADVLVQCCYPAKAEITTPARELSARSVIAASDQVGKIAARNEVKKLVLTHFRKKSDELMQSILDDVRLDYDGETILGEDLMAFDA